VISSRVDSGLESIAATKSIAAATPKPNPRFSPSSTAPSSEPTSGCAKYAMPDSTLPAFATPYTHNANATAVLTTPRYTMPSTISGVIAPMDAVESSNGNSASVPMAPTTLAQPVIRNGS
jgi:hypothetical protein